MRAARSRALCAQAAANRATLSLANRTTLSLALVAACCASLACVPAAFAQAGPGAERYEVTITPPKRPGSAAAPDPAVPEAASPDAAPQASPSDAALQPPGAAPTAGAADGSGADAADGSGADAAKTAAGSAEGAAEPAAMRAATAAPLRTLQVGAFRQRKSADSLHDALAASFKDVTVVEVQSGGEPLYRVNVGRLPHGPALDELRRRLVAAGHPAFEVVPPPSASD